MSFIIIIVIIIIINVIVRINKLNNSLCKQVESKIIRNKLSLLL